MTPDEARARLARPKVAPEQRGGTGRLADVIGVAAARDYFERRQANRVLLRHVLKRIGRG